MLLLTARNLTSYNSSNSSSLNSYLFLSHLLDSLLSENRKNVGKIEKEGRDSEVQIESSESMESSGNTVVIKIIF